jgi:hypothetical protein
VLPPLAALPFSLASLLYAQWSLLEERFLSGLKRSFYGLREERRTALAHFQKLKRAFLDYLRRPDTKQQMLTAFQREFNAVNVCVNRTQSCVKPRACVNLTQSCVEPQACADLTQSCVKPQACVDLTQSCVKPQACVDLTQSCVDLTQSCVDLTQSCVDLTQSCVDLTQLDLRRLPEAKGELLLRTEELRDALWEACDAKLADNTAELEAATATSWAQDHSVALGQHFAALVQLEADCFAATGDLVSNFFRAKLKLPIKAASGFPQLTPVLEWEQPLLDEEAETNASDPKAKAAKDAKASPKGAAEGLGELPAWLAPLEESAPQLVAAVMHALATIPTPERNDDMASDPKAKGGGKADAGAEEAEAEAAKERALLRLASAEIAAALAAQLEARLQVRIVLKHAASMRRTCMGCLIARRVANTDNVVRCALPLVG